MGNSLSSFELCGVCQTAKHEERIQQEHDFLDCAKNYDWPQLRQLLEETPDLINAQPGKRWTALHQAAHAGNDLMVSELLHLRADVNAVARDGKKPVDVASAKAAAVLKKHMKRARPDVTPLGSEMRVEVLLSISGAQLIPEVTCHGQDTAEEFGRAVGKQDPEGGKHKYAILWQGRRLASGETLAEAGIIDRASVSVVREKIVAVDVPTLDDIWEQHPGQRDPVRLSDGLGDVVLYKTSECNHEDGQKYSHKGGYFLDREGKPTAYYRFTNFIPVYVQNLRELRVVEVEAHEQKFGGIVIKPAS